MSLLDFIRRQVGVGELDHQRVDRNSFILVISLLDILLIL